MSNKLEGSKDFNDILAEKGLNETKKILSQSLQEIEDKNINNKPLPLTEKEVRTIEKEDIEFFPKPLFDMVTEVSRVTQTPVEFGVYFSISFLSSLIMDKVNIRIKDGYDQPISIPIIILGKSGDGKSSVAKYFLKPLINYEKERIDQYHQDRSEITNYNSLIDDEIAKIRKTGKDSISEKSCKIQALEGQKKQLPVNPCFRSENITPEGIRDFMIATNGKLAIIDSEESGFISNLAGRYSNDSNLTPAIKGWDGDGSLNFRSGKGQINFEKTNVNWSLFSQPAIFRKIKNLDIFIHQGFLARTLIVKPKSRVSKRNYITKNIAVNKDILSFYDNLVNILLSIEQDIIVEFSEEAKISYKCFEQFIEDNRARNKRFGNDVIGGWVEKLKNNLARLAALLTIIDNPNSRIITKNLMDNLIKFSMILINNAESFFEYISQSKDDLDDEEIEAEKLLNIIKAKITKWKGSNSKKTDIISRLLDKGFTASYLKHKLTRNQFTESQLSRLLDILSEKNYLDHHNITACESPNKREVDKYYLSQEIKLKYYE